MKDQVFVIRVGKKYVERFTYPYSVTKVDKAWEKSEGIQIAACCKAVLGSIPYEWPYRDSAEFVAEAIPGAVVRPRPPR